MKTKQNKMNSTLKLILMLIIGFILYFTFISTVYFTMVGVYPTRYNAIIIIFYIIFAGKMIINKCNTIEEEPEEPVRPTNVKNPKKNNTQTLECVICLDDIEKQNSIYDLGCKHHFHQRCIDKWVHYGSTCPLCRIDISVE